MAIRALKQTGSRSIEAALEFISKMGYLDPRNEQIVQVIKQTSPGKIPSVQWNLCTLLTLCVQYSMCLDRGKSIQTYTVTYP